MNYHFSTDLQQSGQACAAPRAPALRSADGQSVSKKLEQFCMAGRGRPNIVEEGLVPTPHLVHFQGRTELQKWLKLGVVDFAETLRGFGEATVRVREAGCTASEGFDKYAITYERCWYLDRKKDQCDCAWLLVYSLRPKVIHCGTPCTKMCQIGERTIDESTEAQNEFTLNVAEHQEAEGLGASIETPKGSLLFEQKKYKEKFGSLEEPKPGWLFYRPEGVSSM